MEENDSAIIQSDGNMTTTNGYDNSPSHHSGSVNLKCESKQNGRRAAICQLDGNQTLYSDDGTTSETDVISESLGESDLESVSNKVVESEDEGSAQDPPPWHEPFTREDEPRTQVLRRINTNNRVAIIAEMPTIAATNTRSIFPKFRHFAEDIIQRQITACFVSEIWQTGK